jgi:[CysO sulfur-carrier protein]-S-L-cysteine hydrolase
MLSINQSVIDAVIAHARKGVPYEACGYLAGKDGVVVRFFPLKNADQSAEHFSFDPAEQFTAVREMRSNGLRIEAVAHSHPATPARLSQEDIRLARDPDVSYVIVSLAEAQPVVKSFRVKDSVVTPEEIEISE